MASSSSFTLRFEMEWSLLLHPHEEHSPFVHFYLSTNASRKVTEISLTIKTTDKKTFSNSGRQLVELAFTGTSELYYYFDRNKTHDIRSFLANVDLNIDFFSVTQNAYEERVTNPAGSLIIPCIELLSGHVNRELIKKEIKLYMVTDKPQSRSVKGGLVLYDIKMAGTGAYDPTPVAMDASALSSIANIVYSRKDKHQRIAAGFIDATETIYETFQPTIPTVSNINSAVWVSRAGIFPPLIYSCDVVEPDIDEGFFSHCIDVVLARFPKADGTLSRREWLVSLRLYAKRADDSHIRMLGTIAGEVLCAYVVHTIYRSDFVYAYDSVKRAMVKILCENFGDVTVDKGAGVSKTFF